MAVTAPKLPPPRRIAQKRSGSVSASILRTLPSAVTISTETTLEAASPQRRPSQLSPSAERVAHDADVRRGAGQGREPVRPGGLGHLSPQHSGLDAPGAVHGVDLDAPHPLHLHEDDVRELAAPRACAVARPLHRDAKVVLDGITPPPQPRLTLTPEGRPSQGRIPFCRHSGSRFLCREIRLRRDAWCG
jgi:hypothetical protein